MILNTSAENFTTWLRNRPLYEQRQDHPSGELILWVQPARIRISGRGTQIVERHGVHWIRNPDPDGPAWREEWLGPVIWFDVCTLADNRIEVISDCEATGAMILYMTTLARIAETWPEARAEMLAYLDEMSEASATGIEWWDRKVNEKARGLLAELSASQTEEEEPEPVEASEPAEARADRGERGELIKRWVMKDGISDQEFVKSYRQRYGELPVEAGSPTTNNGLADHLAWGRRFIVAKVKSSSELTQRDFAQQKGVKIGEGIIGRTYRLVKRLLDMAGMTEEELAAHG